MSAEDTTASTFPRRWTDEQLRAAVAKAKSWRDVARALGLRPTSTHNLRRHVARLRLDTSHFIGRRMWTDQQLRTAVATGSTWAEVLLLLQVHDCAESRIRVKGHAIRLGLDISHLGPSPRDPVPDIHRRAAPRPDMLRVAATPIAMAWFALRGYPTAMPVEPEVYDLLVTFPDGVRRVQIKSTTTQARHGRWFVRVGHRPYSLDKSAGIAPYDPDSLDYFFVVVGDGRLYLIPSQVVAGRIGIYVEGYEAYRVGDASSLLDGMRAQAD